MQSVDFPVIGFRSWMVEPDDRELRSVVQDWHWTTGVNDAACLRRARFHRQPAPVEGCVCGLYAFHDLSRAKSYAYVDGGVVGIVRGWGRLQVHRDGWRAEHAEVLALAAPDYVGRIQGRGRAERVAEHYGVPLLDFNSLEALAPEFGKFVPEELRPTTSVYAGSRGLSRQEELAGLAFVLAPFVLGFGSWFAASRLWRYLRRK